MDRLLIMCRRCVSQMCILPFRPALQIQKQRTSSGFHVSYRQEIPFYRQFSLPAKSPSICYRQRHPAQSCLVSKRVMGMEHEQLSSFVSPSIHRISTRNISSHSRNPNQKTDPGVLNVPFWARLLIVAGFGGGMYYVFHSADHEKDLESEEVRYKEFEKIHLGGDWTLTDHHGNKRSSTDFRGSWIVMYMGFTHCPDICPEEMEKLGKVVQNFDENTKLPSLQPIFITLDPERDTPKVITGYLKDFKSPRIVGFTGTEDEIRDVAKKFRAYFSKGARDEDNDYIVDHTIIIYLINPKGEFVNYYGRNRTVEEVTKSITKHMQNYMELEKLHHV